MKKTTGGNRIVFFLGAGFSKGVCRDIPITSELMGATLKKLQEVGKRSFRQEMVVESVKQVIGKIFPHLEPKEADLESFLGVLDSLRRNKKDAKILRVNPDMVWRTFISALGWAVHYSKDYEDYQKDEAMSTLIKIMQDCQQQGGSVSVLTTNYDLIADKAAFWINDRHLGHPKSEKNPCRDKRRYTYGYGIPIEVFKIKNNKPKRVEDFEPWLPFDKGIPIYKLHGSVNWAYCKKCDRLYLPFEKNDLMSFFLFSHNPLYCFNCGEKYEYLLIPPTPIEESYNNPLLEEIWRCAEDALAKAHGVIFIGYSLPLADPLVTHLILRARAKSSGNPQGRWKYWVFNPDCCVHQRFHSLLGLAEGNDYEEFTPKQFNAKWTERILNTL